MISTVSDASKIEIEFKSDVNTETTMFPYADAFSKYGIIILDTQVGQTDMKVRHIFQKFVEVSVLDLTVIHVFLLFKILSMHKTLLIIFRQQTTTWENMDLKSLTLRTSEYLICLRFPCQAHCS